MWDQDVQDRQGLERLISRTTKELGIYLQIPSPLFEDHRIWTIVRCLIEPNIILEWPPISGAELDWYILAYGRTTVDEAF